jgi:hypothetical protein
MWKSCCALTMLWLSTGALALTAKEQQPPARPTETLVDPSAKGRLPNVLDRLAEKFSKQSPEPKERLSHFNWIDQKDPNTRIKSWKCCIMGASKQTGKEVWNVRISVSPMLAGGGFAVVNSLSDDGYEEVYEYSSGKFWFVKAQGSTLRVITIN